MKKILFFKRANCPNCVKTEEIVKATDFVVEYIDADTNREQVEKYAPQGNWSLPLLVYYEDDTVVNVTTGVVSAEMLWLSHMPLIEIEAMSFRTMRALEMLKREQSSLESLLKSLGFILQAKETPKPKQDLSGFPQGQSPEDEGCEGCGSSEQ